MSIVKIKRTYHLFIYRIYDRVINGLYDIANALSNIATNLTYRSDGHYTKSFTLTEEEELDLQRQREEWFNSFLVKEAAEAITKYEKTGTYNVEDGKVNE